MQPMSDPTGFYAMFISLALDKLQPEIRKVLPTATVLPTPSGTTLLLGFSPVCQDVSRPSSEVGIIGFPIKRTADMNPSLAVCSLVYINTTSSTARVSMVVATFASFGTSLMAYLRVCTPSLCATNIAYADTLSAAWTSTT